MYQIDPILWYVFYTQLMVGVTTWNLKLFPGDESGFVAPSHIQGMIVRTIQH